MNRDDEQRLDENHGLKQGRIGPGTTIGRFSVVAEVGVGGAGRVYEAFDPKLGRRVALKLLRDAGGSTDSSRLSREARALARLDHPNVVRVHDVGLHEGLLFVAMEFASAGTLEDWDREHPVGDTPRYFEALRLLVEAGRGLAAAHAAGLVHRDVKPTNILVGADGRAKVADFGIARPLGDEAPSSRPRDASDGRLLSTDDEASRETTSGNSIGTPGYMAPECFGEGAIGPRADQFSFCVTAWEVLFGERPFRHTDARARLAAIRSGRLFQPERSTVSAEVEALLRRGLRYQPEDRHRELGDLVDGLADSIQESGLRRRQRWRSVAVLAAVVLAGLVYVAARKDGRCEQEAALALEETWSPAHRRELAESLAESGLDVAEETATRLGRGIDTYMDRWRAARAETCEATRIRGERSEARMDAQTSCLDRARRSVQFLLELSSTEHASVVAHEVELLSELPSIDACAEHREMPTAAESESLDAMARGAVLRSAGRAQEALSLLEPVVLGLTDEAAAWARAGVLLEYGRQLADAANPRSALEPLTEAHTLAVAEGLDVTAGAAARALASVHSKLRSSPETIDEWVAKTNSTAVADSTSTGLEIRALESEVQRRTVQTKRSIETLEKGVDAVRGDPTLVPSALRHLALGLHAVRRDEDAASAARQALAAYYEQYGTEHPGAARYELTLSALLGAGAIFGSGTLDAEESERLARSALAKAYTAWGEGHAATSPYLARLATTLCVLGDGYDEGIQLATAALRSHPEGTETHARVRALEAFIRCSLQQKDQFAKEAWDLVYVSQQLYGERHQATLFAQARYVQALSLAPHSQNDGLWKQLLLASALSEEELPGHDVFTAIHIHGMLGSVASRVRPELGRQHAEAILALLESVDVPMLAVESRARRILGYVKFDSGDLEGALEELRLGLELASEGNDAFFLGVAEQAVGVTLERLGRAAEARSHLERAVGALRKGGTADGDLAKAYKALADVNEQLGEYDAAEQNLKACTGLLDERSVDYVIVRAGMVRMAARLRGLGEARTMLSQLEREGLDTDPFREVRILELRGFLRNLEDGRTGYREYSDALDIYVASGGTRGAQRLCRVSPFKLSECGRLGHANPARSLQDPRAGASD